MPRVVRHPLLKEPMVFPTGTPDMEIYNALYNNIFAVPKAGPVPKEEAGFFGGFGEGISTLGGLPEAAKYLARPGTETRKAAAEAGESEYEFQRLKDIEGLGGLGRFVKEQAGSALGFIAAPVTAAGAAARFAPPPLKPFAATGAFLTAAGAQYLTDTTTRQATEQEAKVRQGGTAELPNATKIALTSLGQAGLDVAGFRLFRPLGEMIGLAGRKNAAEMAKEVAKETAKDPIKGAEKLLGKQSIAKGIVGGAAFEAAQEVAQQALERYGAGLDLASDDAIEEYIESAVGGGILGGPIGGASTYAGNVRKGIYNKDYIQQVADAVQGKAVNLGQDWDQFSKQIQIDTPAFDLTDAQGNFLPYTPDLLERIGINPEAKAINVGGRKQVTIPMSEVLKADTSDKTIGTALLNMFRTERFKISEEIKRDSKRMESEELAEKIKEYETLTAALKSYEAIFNPKQSISSPTNFVVQPSPADTNKFVVFNPATNENATKKQFASAENAQRWIDKQLEKENKGKLEPEVKAATPTAPPAPTTPTETPEETAARQAQEVRAQLYTDLANRYPNNPEAVSQITQAAEDLEVTMSPTEALAQAETTYIQDQQAAVEPAPTVEPTPAPEAVVEPVPEEVVKVAPTVPAPKPKSPRAAKKAEGKPYEKYVTQMRDMLAGIDPGSGIYNDLNGIVEIAEQSKDTTTAKELSRLADAYIKTQSLDAFNQIQAIIEQYTPKNAAEMKAAKDATGNAEIANKVAAKVRKDICG